MKSLKKMGVALIVLVSGLGLQGCNEYQVGASVGAVIGAVIGAELADGHHHHRRRHRPPRYRDCYRYYCGYSAVLDLTQDDSVSPAVVKVAEKYEISLYAADTLVEALFEAQEGDLSSLQEVGLSSEDVVAIYRGQDPSVEGIEKLSLALRMEVKETQELLEKFKADLQHSREVQESYYQY